MDADIERVAVVVGDAQHFLLLAVKLDGHQSLETSNAVVDMSDIVAGLEVVEVFEGDGLFGAEIIP